MQAKRLSTLIDRERWSEVEERIFSNPNEAYSWKDGILPIHRACCYKAVPLQVIEALVDAYPMSLQQKSKASGRIPLHFAVCRESSTDSNIFKVILNHYKRGASVKDVRGRLPLSSHLSTSPSLSLEMVKMLVETYPQALFTRSDDQWYPLHHSATRGDWEITQYLIKLNPAALLEENEDDMTPRDIADYFDNYELRNHLLKEEDKRFGGVIRKINEFCGASRHDNNSNVSIEAEKKIDINNDEPQLHDSKKSKLVEINNNYPSNENVNTDGIVHGPSDCYQPISEYDNVIPKVPNSILNDECMVDDSSKTKNTLQNEPLPLLNLKTKIEELESFWNMPSLRTKNIMKRVSAMEQKFFNEIKKGGLKNRILALLYVNGKDGPTWEEWLSEIECFFLEEVRHESTMERVEFLEKLLDGEVKNGNLHERLLCLNNLS